METSTFLLAFGVFVLLIWSAFFSGSETALTSVSKARLHQMEKNGTKKISKVKSLVANPETLLSTILLGNNLVNIAASSLTTGLFIKLFGDAGILYATLIMTLLVLIFAEVLPKTLASHFPEKIALLVVQPMQFLVTILSPATWLIRKFNRLVMRAMGIRPEKAGNFTEGDVRGAIGLGLEEGVLEKGEHRMLDSVLDLDDLSVEDVMVHRASMETLSINTPIADLTKHLSQTRFSRIPMWKGEPDNIIGILHIKDFYAALLNAAEEKKSINLQEIIQDAYFIPDGITAQRQLLEFRKKHRHMALVVDEYGDLQGLVTLEDILEEIVGEIEDEHDLKRPDYTREANGSILVAGHYAVRDANRDLNWDLPEDDAVTIAGLMIEKLDHIPTLGESLSLGNLTLQVAAKKRHTLVKIRITETQHTTIKED